MAHSSAWVPPGTSFSDLRRKRGTYDFCVLHIFVPSPLSSVSPSQFLILSPSSSVPHHQPLILVPRPQPIIFSPSCSVHHPQPIILSPSSPASTHISYLSFFPESCVSPKHHLKRVRNPFIDPSHPKTSNNAINYSGFTHI